MSTEENKDAARGEMPRKAYAQPTPGHVHLGGGLRATLFIVPVGLLAIILFAILGLTSPGAVLVEVVFAFVVGLVDSGVRVAAQWERGVVLRFGKFEAVKGPGIIFIIPVLDNVRFIDIRLLTLNIPSQKVITKDNVLVTVDAVIYYRIVDPVRATFEVQNFAYAATTLAQTNLRNLIGDKMLDETLTARDTINANLRNVLDEATNTWGVKLTRVEVQKIDPPADITEAMSRQMKAERDKRAQILEAEGFKQAQILQAEGLRQSEILKAEGDAQARVLRANAEAKAIEVVSNAAEGFFKERAEVSKRLDVLRDVLAQQTKFIVPAGSDLVNVLGLEGTPVVPVKKA